MQCHRCGTNKGTRYYHGLVGNRPEMMPMDNSLNQDIHEGVKALQRVAMGMLWLKQDEILGLHDDLEVSASWEKN